MWWWGGRGVRGGSSALPFQILLMLICSYLQSTNFTHFGNNTMTFGVLSLLRLKLHREPVPLFKGVKGRQFPERIPTTLIVLCFFNSLLKLLTPMILQETYSSISKPQTDAGEYLVLITVVIASIALSQLLLIAYTLTLSVYRLNVKRELSARMLQNNFDEYQAQLESSEIGDKKSEFNMELAIKINTKLAVYLHNYYDSYLSLIFECLNIIVIFVYLLYKLSFSLFFGVAIAGLVMYKSLTIARQINEIRFGNISLRARRLKILQNFFNRITEFKMCWLDKWIYQKITTIEHEFQSGLRKIKMLDCWCVALWQFTSVGISSIVISAYFLLGFNEKVDKESVFTPSTFVYLLGMLNFPLNALSWYIAGMKTAHRAIEEIKKDISTESISRNTDNKISETEQSYVVPEPLTLNLQQPKVVGVWEIKSLTIPRLQVPKGKVYSVQGPLAEMFLDKLVFLFEDKVKRGFVEENSWLSASPLETFRMELNVVSLQEQQKLQILRLMELFRCGDIPLTTSTKSYSGGEKLRISLVRAFNLGEIIIINTNLNSLDSKTQGVVKQNIRSLVTGVFSQIKKQYTVFIRDNEDIADYRLSFTENAHNSSIQLKQTNSVFKTHNVAKIHFSREIQKYVFEIDTAIALEKDKQSGKKKSYSTQKLQRIEELDKIEEKSVVSWSSFGLYYKSYKHIIFVVSLIVACSLSNYYNYYVNTYIKLEEYNQTQVVNIILLTILFAIALFFRSFYFADANLDESDRICHNLNKNVIMNELSFYASQEVIQEETSSIYSKSKMICALSSDTETISDIFPFSTNIFANNVTVILSSMAVIIVQVPPSIVLIVLLVIYANDLNRSSHKKDEYLQIAMKEKDVDIYRVLSEIQNGKKYILIHHKLRSYSKQLFGYQEEYNSVDWLSIKFKNYVNLKYKIMMILFLIVAVVFYSLFHVFDFFGGGTKENNSSSGLALLIQYTIQLSNNLLFFVMSIWEIKGQAVSLERVRPYLEQTPSIKNRIESADKMVKKLARSSQSQQSNPQLNNPLVCIQNMDFAYQANPDQLIFKNMTFKINRGDRIMIRGRSGSGKTTLYKLLTSAYPKIMNLVDEQFVVYFSPQHPLLLPDAETIFQNVDPYGVAQNIHQVSELLSRYNLQGKGLIKDLCYQQQIMINNIRAHLYGCKGIIIYDEPQIVIEEDTLTYLIVTHHHEFKHNLSMWLQNKTLVERKHQSGIDQEQLLRELN